MTALERSPLKRLLTLFTGTNGDVVVANDIFYDCYHVNFLFQNGPASHRLFRAGDADRKDDDSLDCERDPAP